MQLRSWFTGADHHFYCCSKSCRSTSSHQSSVNKRPSITKQQNSREQQATTDFGYVPSVVMLASWQVWQQALSQFDPPTSPKNPTKRRKISPKQYAEFQCQFPNHAERFTTALPDSVFRLFAFLAREGVQITGLFRRPGNITQMKAILQILVKNAEPVDWSQYNIYTVANVAKRFLLSLPLGLFGTEGELELLQGVSSNSSMDEQPTSLCEDDEYQMQVTRDHLSVFCQVLQRIPAASRDLAILMFGILHHMLCHLAPPLERQVLLRKGEERAPLPLKLCTDQLLTLAEGIAKSVAGSIFHTCAHSVAQVDQATRSIQVILLNFHCLDDSSILRFYRDCAQNSIPVKSIANDSILAHHSDSVTRCRASVTKLDKSVQTSGNGGSTVAWQDEPTTMATVTAPSLLLRRQKSSLLLRSRPSTVRRANRFRALEKRQRENVAAKSAWFQAEPVSPVIKNWNELAAAAAALTRDDRLMSQPLMQFHSVPTIYTTRFCRGLSHRQAQLLRPPLITINVTSSGVGCCDDSQMMDDDDENRRISTTCSLLDWNTPDDHEDPSFLLLSQQKQAALLSTSADSVMLGNTAGSRFQHVPAAAATEAPAPDHHEKQPKDDLIVLPTSKSCPVVFFMLIHHQDEQAADFAYLACSRKRSSTWPR